MALALALALALAKSIDYLNKFINSLSLCQSTAPPLIDRSFTSVYEFVLKLIPLKISINIKEVINPFLFCIRTTR
mgnify:FL=1